MIAKSEDSPTSPTDFTIPLIDISPYLLTSSSSSPDPVATAKIVSSLRTACLTTGFFLLTGIDSLVSIDLQTRYFSAIKKFFALPLETKSKIDFKTSGCNRGYEAVGGQRLDMLSDASPSTSGAENGHESNSKNETSGAEREKTKAKGSGADQKEGFSIRGLVSQPLSPNSFLSGPNLWPPESEVPGFRAVTEEYFRAAHELSKVVFRLLALSLGLGEGYFEEFVRDEGDRKLRCHRYPSSLGDEGKEREEGRERGIGAGPHTDFGALTLLLQENPPSSSPSSPNDSCLQVLHNSTWYPIPPRPSTYVVNLGDLMQRWTNGKYRSTMHRVLMPPPGSQDRYSVAFFNDGPMEWVIRALPGTVDETKGEVERYGSVTVEEHLRGRYGGSYL